MTTERVDLDALDRLEKLVNTNLHSDAHEEALALIAEVRESRDKLGWRREQGAQKEQDRARYEPAPVDPDAAARRAPPRAAGSIIDPLLIVHTPHTWETAWRDWLTRNQWRDDGLVKDGFRAGFEAARTTATRAPSAELEALLEDLDFIRAEAVAERIPNLPRHLDIVARADRIESALRGKL